MIDVIMPQMGESIVEGTLTKWLKKPGESVERDEPLFEISTDKVDTEIPSPVAGTLGAFFDEPSPAPLAQPACISSCSPGASSVVAHPAPAWRLGHCVSVPSAVQPSATT